MQESVRINFITTAVLAHQLRSSPSSLAFCLGTIATGSNCWQHEISLVPHLGQRFALLHPLDGGVHNAHDIGRHLLHSFASIDDVPRHPSLLLVHFLQLGKSLANADLQITLLVPLSSISEICPRKQAQAAQHNADHCIRLVVLKKTRGALVSHCFQPENDMNSHKRPHCNIRKHTPRHK